MSEDITEETAVKAMRQIAGKCYDDGQMSEDIKTTQIYHYGSTLDGKNMLIKCKIMIYFVCWV